MPADPNTPDPNTPDPNTPDPNTPDPVVNHPDPDPTTIPSHTVLPTPEEKQFTESIPEAYRDRPYLKGVKSIEEVYKKLEGAQELIGKKTIDIPGPDASAEEKDAFWSKIRPENASDYEFQIGDPANADKEFITSIKGLFHKASLSKEQATVIQTGFDQVIKDIATKQGISTTKQDTDFDKLSTDLYGTNTDKVLADAKILIDKYRPESMAEHVKGLSNENLIILTSVLEGIRKDFISEDSLVHLGPGSGTAEDIPTLRDQARKIMASEAFGSTFHKDHAKAQADIKEIYSKIDRIQKFQKK